jgi:REP element-mobilizing transposase RayT
MPRKARKYIISPNALYHIVSRGNNQRRIFRSGRDYKKFLSILEETKKKYPFYLYSYNLLPNHYHLEIETREILISKIMHQINNSYAKYFRRRYGGSGHLFQERFFSALVNKESYFWALAYYIDLNAVEAGIVKKPEDYRWSSYSIYLQKDYKGKLIDRERFLRYGDEDLERSRRSYLKFINEALKVKKKRKPPFPVNENMI